MFRHGRIRHLPTRLQGLSVPHPAARVLCPGGAPVHRRASYSKWRWSCPDAIAVGVGADFGVGRSAPAVPYEGGQLPTHADARDSYVRALMGYLTPIFTASQRISKTHEPGEFLVIIALRHFFRTHEPISRKSMLRLYIGRFELGRLNL